MKKLLFTFAVLALSIASAKTYQVKFFETSIINGKELKPGDYKLEMGENNKITLTDGKEKVEAQVKVESEDKKFANTTVRYRTENGKNSVTEIRLGGTKTKLVLD